MLDSDLNRANNLPDDYDTDLDAGLLEFAYDAQTSGGLLLSVPAAKAAELVAELNRQKTLAAAVIGSVHARGKTALRIRN